MKENNFISKNYYVSIALVALLVLSGCGACLDCEKKSGSDLSKSSIDTSGAVVATWGDGTSMLTQNEFDEKLDVLMNERPEYKKMAGAFMPMLKEKLLTGLVNEKTIGKYIRDNKISESKEYIVRRNQIVKAATSFVDFEFFSKHLQVKPSNDEKRKFYEENKDRMNFILVSHGGVKAKGVEFEKESDAQEFFKKATVKGTVFDKLVDEYALRKKHKDFDLVTQQSRGLDVVLRKKILEIKEPKVELIKTDKFWVVNALQVSSAKYRPYESVEGDIEKMVQQANQEKALETQLAKLKGEYGVTIKVSFLNQKNDKPDLNQLVANLKKRKESSTNQAKNVNVTSDKRPAAKVA